MYAPKDCVEGILADLSEIERDYISKGNFKGASEAWQASLGERQYLGMKDRIMNQLHSGMSFCASVDNLGKKLEEGRSGLELQMVKAFGAQTRLPDGSHL